MPRKARKISKTGIYHVMVRGINKEPIFTDGRDNQVFLNVLKQAKENWGFELYAYCLMKNHGHFLIKDTHGSISSIMKDVCGKYGRWFNVAHDRMGHVFQDRFRSECVETNIYLHTVFRYILNNPVKAKLVKRAEEYPWSSCNEYLSGIKTITDTDHMLSFLQEGSLEATWKLKMELERDDTLQDLVYLTMDDERRSDEEADQIVEQLKKKWSIQDLLHLNDTEKQLVVGHLKALGLKKRQYQKSLRG
ncbi:transposase [Alkalibacter rhizosphaerae]|uniref:Transposase n=1 Tax=Alkalibacter rhizosphaerae TaxID=2815577 RepID=A0A974XNX8_9FIRM|nr:transposase [Alkalibacter rhizosphaerae]QSX09331.1 transposase [Alkalibacter rhizosphaerae]